MNPFEIYSVADTLASALSWFASASQDERTSILVQVSQLLHSNNRESSNTYKFIRVLAEENAHPYFAGYN